MKNKKVFLCSKRKFTKREVRGFLGSLKNGGYNKMPWRDEVSYYECERCGSYHTSSYIERGGNSFLSGSNYFDLQKEKWGNWLKNKSHKSGHINY